MLLILKVGQLGRDTSEITQTDSIEFWGYSKICKLFIYLKDLSRILNHVYMTKHKMIILTFCVSSILCLCYNIALHSVTPPHNFVICNDFFSFYIHFIVFLGDQSIKYLLFLSPKYGNKDTLDALNTILAPVSTPYSLTLK